MNTVSTISNCAGSHKRIAWIDVSKGFGIYFIVLGHLLISGTLRKWIFAFHVPFFFFLSGLTFNVSQPFFTFLKKKFFSIMLPYYFFSILSIGIYDVMVKAVPSFGGAEPVGKQMLIMLYGNSRPHTMIWNTPLWFLPALFLVLICVYGFENGIAKIAGENQLLQLFMCLGVVVLSWGVGILFESRGANIRLPMQFESGVFMIGFVMLGILFSHLQMKERWHRQDKTRIILCAFVLLLVGIGVSTVNGFAEVRILHYGGNGLLFILSSVLLGLAFVSLSFVCEEMSLLKKAGQGSLVIMLIHKFPIVFFQELCPGTKELLADPNSFAGICCAVVLAVLVIILCLIAGKIIESICPVLVGKNKSVNHDYGS